MSRLLSGVRSSCDMLARNSDLYLEVRASCLAFSSRAWRACSTSRFLRSTSSFWCGEQAGLFLQLLVGLLQLLLPALQLLGERLRLLEQVLRAHVGFDRVEHDADRFGELIEERLVRRVERSNEASSSTAFTWPSKTTGSTMMFCGAALAQAGGDADVVRRHIGEQDLLLLQGALADQALAQAELVADALLAAGRRSWPSSVKSGDSSLASSRRRTRPAGR